MTNNEAIICLKGIKRYGENTFTSNQGDWQDSLDIAISSIEKCQKIEEICKKDEYPEYLFDDIVKVLRTNIPGIAECQ